MSVSKEQARILIGLLGFDEIRCREDGYCFEGEGYFEPSKEQLVSAETLVIYKNGDSVQITTDKTQVRFLLVSGKPIKEPIAWMGPIVMNTQAELQTAFSEYRNGTFLKSH